MVFSSNFYRSFEGGKILILHYFPGAQACTYPGTTISGRMSSVKFYYKIGETVTFTCEPGYKLKGAPMLRCLK